MYTLQDLENVKARVSRRDLKGNEVWSKEVEVENVAGNSKRNVMSLPSYDSDKCIVERLELFLPDDTVIINDYLVNDVDDFQELNSLPQVKLEANLLSSNGNQRVFEVFNPSHVAGVSLKFNVRRNDTGEAVLPAYFDDGYINLLPGEKRSLRVECGDFTGTLLFVEGYNAERQKILDL